MVSIPPGRTAGDRGIGAVSAAGRRQHRRLVAARRRRQVAAVQPPHGRAPGPDTGADGGAVGLRRPRRAGQGAVRRSPGAGGRRRPGSRRPRDHVPEARRNPDLAARELAADPRRRRRHARLPAPLLRLHRPQRADRHPRAPGAAARHRAGDREDRQLGVGRRAQPHDLVRRAVPHLRHRPGELPRRLRGLPGVHPPRRPRGRPGRGGIDVRRRRRVRVERARDPRRRGGAMVPGPGPGRARPRRHAAAHERHRPGHHRPGDGRPRDR